MNFIKKRLWYVLALFCAFPAHADDRDAFTSIPVPPNIVWLLDNSGSMSDLSCYDSSVSIPSQKCFRSSDILPMAEPLAAGVTLCRSTFINARSPAYDPTANYIFDPGINVANANIANLRYRWDNAAVWRVDSPEGGADQTSIANYCSSARFPNCWQRSRCIYSLRTHGYFAERKSSSDTSDFNVCVGAGDPELLCGTAVENTTGRVTVAQARVMGNLLEFFPPKYAVARKVIREVNGVTWNGATSSNSRAPATKQRLGLFTFNGVWGAKIQSHVGPRCDQSYDQTQLDATRDALVDQVDKMNVPSNTPLGESLDDIGCYFGAGDSPRPCHGGDYEDGTKTAATDLGLKTNYFKANASKPAPICKSCQRNFVIIVTDGFPTEDGKSVASGGDDANDYSLMSIADTQHGVEVVAGVTTTGNPILPSVSKYLFLNDLDTSTAETENIITYAVSFGLADSLDNTKCFGTLEKAASWGGGRCFPAADYDQLKLALQTVLQSIDARTRAFTSPAIQATRTQGNSAVNLAVFKPHPSLPIWRGNLFAFHLFDERVDGTFAGGTAAPDEVFVLDANNQPVKFDAEGNLLSQPIWDAALCLGGDLNNNRGSFVPEDPHALDVTACRRYADENSANARRIFTKINPTIPGTGDLFGVGAANAQAATLAPLMGITGTNSAAKIIKYVRGFDMLDAMETGNVTTPADRSLSTFSQRDGWWKLGDIYHSIPTASAQPTEFYKVYGAAYDKYLSDNKTRQRIVIAGSNDGMIHAFAAGNATSTSALGLSTYNDGNGQELWSFIPPHMLSSYANMLDCPDDVPSKCYVHIPTTGTVYRYRVDGSPLMRDAYIPDSVTNLSTRATATNLNNVSNAQYWRTITVVGDRDGGKKFTALDITDPLNPRFLWEFPAASQLGTGLNQRADPAAYSWADTYPSPPPIFPMKFKDTTSIVPGAYYLRWVVALPGGFDRNQVSGRGIYIVDAGSGELLWKFEFGMAGASRMIFSFAAPPAGAPSLVPALEGPFVNALIAVDTGGQMWRVDASDPAVLAPLAQWTATRIFAATDDVTPAASNGDSTLTLNEYTYRPFFQVPALTFDENGYVWAYIGTGDRDLLANPNPTHLHGVNLAPEIRSYVCGSGAGYDATSKGNRIYAIRTDTVSGDPPRPWREATLVPLNLAAPTPIPLSAPGFMISLAAGEKINNAAELFQGYAYFTSFTPTGACDTITASAAISCDQPTGVGKLYTIHYRTGAPPVGIQSITSLGSGVPTAPAVSSGMGNGRASAAILGSTSQDPTPRAIRAAGRSNLVERMLKLIIPESVHQQLRNLGSNH